MQLRELTEDQTVFAVEAAELVLNALEKRGGQLLIEAVVVSGVRRLLQGEDGVVAGTALVLELCDAVNEAASSPRTH